jgi:hypothetical protein
MLLDKNFNISKGKKPLADFLEDVHDFKVNKTNVKDWAEVLNLDMSQVASSNSSVEVLLTAFSERTRIIRGDVEKFIRKQLPRVDL